MVSACCPPRVKFKIKDSLFLRCNVMYEEHCRGFNLVGLAIQRDIKLIFRQNIVNGHTKCLPEDLHQSPSSNSTSNL